MIEIEEKLKQIRKRIQDFPAGPGLYFMKGPADKVLYIGKAATVDFLETPNEVEAVLAEARLIKDIRPPYNTDLVFCTALSNAPLRVQLRLISKSTKRSLQTS